MIERIVSPGVFTRENDATFLATGVSQIGAAVIGPTLFGQAFMPTPVTNANDFDSIFGGNSDKTYVPYAVKNYLKNAGIVHVVRVLGEQGWSDANTRTQGQNRALHLYVGSGSAWRLGAVLTPTSGSNTLALVGTDVTLMGPASAFQITSGSTTLSCSFDRSNPNYILNVFGTDPLSNVGNAISSNLYIYGLFGNHCHATQSDVNTFVSLSGGNLTFSVSGSYSPAMTPWIQSQKSIAGGPFNLFKISTISDGTDANRLYKIIVDSVDKPLSGSGEYGKFNINVRTWNDYDYRQSVVETFTDCNLDPASKNYVLKKIGDRYTTVDSNGKLTVYGEYENKSKFIRVIPASTLEQVSNEVVPFGHAPYLNPFSGSNVGTIPYPSKSYQGTSDAYDRKVAWGLDFSDSDSYNFLMPLVDSAITNSGVAFNLDNERGHKSSSLYTESLSGSTAPSEMLKFVVGFQGGWDGMPPNIGRFTSEAITATNVFGFDCSTAAASGTLSFKKAINALQNPDEFDLNMIVIPGIIETLHPKVTELARNVCVDRGDCFFLMDVAGLGATKESAVTAVEGIDDNYTATYYPWVKIKDTVRDKSVWVPPSVVLAGVIAFNDKVSAPWYAPAGLNRGGLTDVIDVKNRLSHSDRDFLYENRVNPIAVFPGQGPSVWGQKTLQKKASALDRLNVRRLLIEIEKFIASTARYLVFEPSTNATRNQFLRIVNPYLESVKNRSGIYAYKVVMDETLNTPDVIDRNLLKGAIYIQPTRSAEFIELTLNIMPTGAVFS